MSQVGDQIKASNAAWSFGGNVPEHFQQHAKRSIPFYEEGHALICHLSDFFVKPKSICYDLGASTGELSKKLLNHHKNKKPKFILIDQEKKMLDAAKENLCNFEQQIELSCLNIDEVEFQASDLIVCYYTLQFLPLFKREGFLKKVFQALNKGGAFILFEKILADDAKMENLSQAVYMDYKLNQGYSAEDIVNKMRSLKGVLEPNRSIENKALMEGVGFERILSVFKWVSFEGWVAIK